MGITERKLRQREEVRNGIINATRQLVMEEGWQSLSIRKIADAIEYSVPVIYDHFENKEALMHEFTIEGFSMLNAKLEAKKQTIEDPSEQLLGMAYAYWDFAFENKEYYQLMFGLGMPSCESVKTVPELGKFGGLIIETLVKIIASGKHKDADPILKHLTFWSILHGLISINMMGKTHSHPEMNQLILKDAIAGFIKGLKE